MRGASEKPNRRKTYATMSSGSKKWQSAFSFSDRMNAILKMQAILCMESSFLVTDYFDRMPSYRSAFPETAPAQAQIEARSIESNVFAQASSQEGTVTMAWKVMRR